MRLSSRGRRFLWQTFLLVVTFIALSVFEAPAWAKLLVFYLYLALVDI